jgi:hypothetical protein
MAKLTECMKLKPATPEQQACLKSVEALRQPAATAKSMAAPPPAVKPKSTAAPGSTPPKVIEPPPEVKAAAATVHLNGAPVAALGSSAQGMSIGGIGSGIAVGDIKGLDLETAMMAIQSQRANLLENQLKTQMEGIQKRNDDIAALNTLLGDLKKFRPAGTDKEKWGNLGATVAEGKANYARVKAVGLPMPSGADEVNEAGGNGIYDAKQKTYDAWNEEIKGKIDSLNNGQQMDMLRMQSLTNKRNEAFDLMTNFIKKMADSRSSVLGNMR